MFAKKNVTIFSILGHNHVYSQKGPAYQLTKKKTRIK